MNSRFKFLSTVDPNAIPPNQIKSRFNKFTLATTNTSKMETKGAADRKETISADVSNTATMTTIIEQSKSVQAAIPERVISKVSTATNSGQKPKILMYESTVTSKHDTSDVMTDDDTNSVGSSIDADFVHAIDTKNETKMKNAERVANQLESLNISTTTIDQRTTQDKSTDDLQNLSHQFTGMELVKKPETDSEMVKTEEHLDETVQNVSALTLSSTDTEANDKSKAMTDDDKKSSVIILTDSDDESLDQPPLKIIPRPMEDYNVSSSLPADAVANLPSSSLMHKINKFFDNVPSLNASLNETVSSNHLEKSIEQENESIYVSETTYNDDDSESASNRAPSTDNKSSVHDDVERNIDLAEHSSASVVPPTCDYAIEKNEMADDAEIRNVPVTKSRSEQAQPVSKTQSGSKLKTSNSTPIIESSVHNADGVKRSNSNNMPGGGKNAGSSIKFNTGSNGHLNIAAKININIQISNNDSSTSEDSSSETSDRDEATLNTPAIESEPIPETANTEENPTNDSSSSDSATSSPATQAKSVPSSPEQHQRQQHQPQVKRDRGCDTPKTPSAVNRIKSYEFVAPKSMTKTNAADDSSYKTPRRKAAKEVDKENGLPEQLPTGFEIDKSIGVDPKDQLLLHQVYGDAWKTPEVLRCYSAVKGHPAAAEPMRVVQSAQVSHRPRFSRGFNVFKRNIADDLDSTRWDELSVIEGPAADEISPLKNDKNEGQKAMSSVRKEPSIIAEEDEVLSPKAALIAPPKTTPKATPKKPTTKATTKSTSKATPRRKNVKNSFLDDGDDESCKNQKLCPPPPPTTTSTKKSTKPKRQLQVPDSPPDTSQSLLRRDKDVVQKRNPVRTPAQKAVDRLRKICDSDSEESDEFMTSDEDDDWDAEKNALSSSASSSLTDDEYEPRTARKRGQLVGASSTAKKKAAAKGTKLIYLDLSSEEVVEVDENHQTNVPEDDLAEITRKFLESDLNDSAEVKKPEKPLRRKLFTPKYYEFEDTQINEIFQTESRLIQPINKPNVNDEVKLKIPIPIFTSLTHKLFESKEFAMPKSPAPKSKTKGDTPKENPFETLQDTTYSFLKSLDVITSMRLCHPDAIKYRKNFNAHKEELCDVLYKLYNEKVFDGKLNTPITWNKKLLTTAGRCRQFQRSTTGRTASVELSTKVITSSDRLRCTLIHELCHAAVWLFNGESGGHGTKWKAWARRSNEVFPELPIIATCHNYDIEYKYTYQCDICSHKSSSHSKSKKVENIRCSYCHGSISVYLNKKQKDGQIVQTPVRAASGFAKFVKEKYKEFKEPGIKHADVMKLISAAFSSLSVEEKRKY